MQNEPKAPSPRGTQATPSPQPRGRGSFEPELETMRHSAAHVMAAAVERLFPGTRLGVGPTVENGFYYDVDAPQRLSPDDLARSVGAILQT